MLLISSIFSFALVCAMLIIIFMVSSLSFENFQFWPPPKKSSWQYHTFWLLFRCVFISIILLSILDFNTLNFWQQNSRLYIGAFFLVIGLSLACHSTFYLGWANAHGEKVKLTTSGYYAWSRNPIYVVSIVGFVGWALLVNSLDVYILFALLISFYFFAPFLEEPWLEDIYGEAYISYKNKVPRFIGLPSIET